MNENQSKGRQEARLEPVVGPCPFCGAMPSGPHRSGGGDERNGYNFVVQIACKCGASISKPSHKGSGGWCDDTGQALAEVVAAWNARSNAS